jgi:hypothetical protein
MVGLVIFGGVENVIFRIASAPKGLVLRAALLALALVPAEAGASALESRRPRDRSERSVEVAGVGPRDDGENTLRVLH